ncbi:MAG: hypothetical protein ABIQ41_00280 [Gemmatimonadales bacterium]
MTEKGEARTTAARKWHTVNEAAYWTAQAALLPFTWPGWLVGGSYYLTLVVVERKTNAWMNEYTL